MKTKKVSRYIQNNLQKLEWDAVVRQYIAEIKTKRLSTNTVFVYERTLRRFREFITLGQAEVQPRMADVSRDKALAYIQHRLDLKTVYANHPNKAPEERSLSPWTIHQDVRGLKTFGTWLEKNGYENPFARLESPKLPQRMKEVLFPEEINTLAQVYNPNTAFGTRWQAMLALELQGMLRVSELVSVRMDQLNLDRQYLRVIGKGDKERIVPFGNQATLALTRYINLFRNDEKKALTVFVSLEGDPLTVNGAENILKHVRAKCGLSRLHWHLLRHTGATYYMLSDGADLLKLRDIMGHRSVTTTEIYLHLSEKLRAVLMPDSRRPNVFETLQVSLVTKSQRGRPVGVRRPIEPHPD